MRPLRDRAEAPTTAQEGREQYASRLQGVISVSFATKNVIAVGCGAGSYMIEKLARFGPASLRLSVSALLAALEAAPPVSGADRWERHNECHGADPREWRPLGRGVAVACTCTRVGVAGTCEGVSPLGPSGGTFVVGHADEVCWRHFRLLPKRRRRTPQAVLSQSVHKWWLRRGEGKHTPPKTLNKRGNAANWRNPLFSGSVGGGYVFGGE